MKNNKRRLYYGLLLIGLSFLYWFLPLTNNLVGFANAVFSVGNIMVFDYLSERYGNFSLLAVPNRRRHFLIIGLIFGLVLEFYLNWVGKFWYFPRWDIVTYALIFVPGFAFYSFYLIETYLGTKAILEYWFIRRTKAINFKGLKNIFTFLGIFGAIMLSSGTTYLVMSMTESDWKSAISINQARYSNPENWYFYFIIFVGLWLLLEFFEYQKRETSLIYQIIRGNPWPLVAIFVAGFFSAAFYEVFNIHGGLWRYVDANVPFNHIKFMDFPIMMYIGWPFHYLPVLSLYRLLFKNESDELMT